MSPETYRAELKRLINEKVVAFVRYLHHCTKKCAATQTSSSLDLLYFGSVPKPLHQYGPRVQRRTIFFVPAIKTCTELATTKPTVPIQIIYLRIYIFIYKFTNRGILNSKDICEI